MENLQFLRDIPLFEDWVVIEPVNKGWSEDKKYYIKDKDGRQLLLRLSDFEAYDRKRIEYERVVAASKLGINMSMPVDFGVCADGKKVYSILTWVEGEDAIDVLPTLDEAKQYHLGVKAGKILRKIHTIPAPEGLETWEIRYKQKTEYVIDKYLQCGYKVDHEHRIIKYIRDNLCYLTGRPLVFQHGDYHVGNLLITPEGGIGVIDFNRSDYGDPWEEYDRYIFTWNVSKAFANGQIHGYFNGSVPNEFFRLLCLYNARNIVASIPWSIPFGKADLDNMLELSEKVIKSYEGFTTHIPTWHKEPMNQY